LNFLKLRFEGVNALRELLPDLLAPLAPPRGRVGADQSYNRESKDKSNQTQGKGHDEVHRHHSERFAAYPSTETESKQRHLN
jgi:hypothetical protein